MDLEAKAALISGGGGGLGSAIASRLAKSGVDVCVTFATDEAAARAACAAVDAQGRRSFAVKMDQTNPDTVEAAVNAAVERLGGLDILARIMEQEGMARLRKFMAHRPPATESARRMMIAAFLEKYAVEGKVLEDASLPGWTNETIERLTDIYDDDLEVIRRLPGVDFIEP